MNHPIIRHVNDIPPVDCPCGKSRRIITCNDTSRFSVHRTDIEDARSHYHKTLTEIYYILQGEGQMVLDNFTINIRPGHCVVIPPGVRHFATEGIQTIIVSIPSFNPADEYYDE
ncbi:cupin domain-containing protein [candidate division KSB1 bacterium]|nr:cupin domain-containing protein [candidate division KSB1 bacterium]